MARGYLKYLILLWCCFALGHLYGQGDSVRLSNRFDFADGLYRSHAAMAANRPDVRWTEVEAALAVNTITFQARLGPLRVKATGELIPATEFWGFSHEGVPYLRIWEVDRRTAKKTGAETADTAGVVLFAGLQYTGRISYFGFPDDSTRMVTIKAYNPLTGKPFREGKVPRTETFYREFMLHMDTGEIAPLSWPQLRAWIRDDQQLLQQLSRLEAGEIDLVRVLQTYDSRNPFFMRRGG